MVHGIGTHMLGTSEEHGVQKTFFEKRNMDLMAANKRAAQKRSRMRRETIAHFGPVTDDGEDVASPCSGATRDSEMSIDAGFSDADADPTMTNGAQPSVLPAIGEDQEAPETTGTLVDDDQDGSSKKRCSRGVSPADADGLLSHHSHTCMHAHVLLG